MSRTKRNSNVMSQFDQKVASLHGFHNTITIAFITHLNKKENINKKTMTKKNQK